MVSRSIRAVSAAVVATTALAQVELRGEDGGGTFLVGVAIEERGQCCSLWAARREFIPGDFRVRRDCFQAALAEAERLG